MSSSLKQSSRIKTILLALFVFAVYLFLSMMFTSWYTRHGEKIKVPGVVGMPAKNAEEVLNEKDLLMVITDSVYNEEMRPNTIVEQDPKPDSDVKPGRKIYVTINTGIKPKVKMPRLINGSGNLAIVLLQNSGLKLGRIDSVKSTFGDGLVMRQKFNGQDIAPNTPLTKGSIIDIVVSKKISLMDSTAVKNMQDGMYINPEEEL